jgi:RNA polymerase sigma factor (sigma-70 family)
MEASTLQPPASLAQPQPRIALASPLLRLRSDEQLVALFRAGHEEAFRVIHDRYHKRLFAYARQMLPARQDAEDALQDVFVRAYSGLRASDRDLALRAWLFRVARNRCIDELRRPTPPPPEVLHLVRTGSHDPLAEIDLRESLRRLVGDIRRLPEQQRSALLMRELAGMSYAELASSLGVSVGAVKSLLVRARMGLAQAAEARDTACTVIEEQLVEAHDRGIRPTANTRKHVRDCSSCKSFRHDLRGVSRQLAATAPAIGPLGFLTKLLGVSGSGGAGAGGGVALVGGGTTASAGGLALGTGHVATLIVAAMATAGGAVELQHTILPAPRHAAHARPLRAIPRQTPGAVATASSAQLQASAGGPATALGSIAQPSSASVMSPGQAAATHRVNPDADSAAPSTPTGGAGAKRHTKSGSSGAKSTTTTTTGTSSSGPCTAPASSSANPTTSGTAAATTSSSPSATTAPSSSGTASSPSSSTPATTPTCGSTPASPTGTSAPSSASSTAATGSSTAATGSTSTTTGSGSSVAANSSPSPGSSQSSSTASSTSVPGR